jgi:hypothetical protein
VDITKIYRCCAASEGFDFPKGTSIDFRNLWQLSDSEKSDIASKVTETVLRAEESALVDKATALKELRQSSNVTGIFTNITDEMITDAENEPPPIPEMPGEEPQNNLPPNIPGASEQPTNENSEPKGVEGVKQTPSE